MPRRSIRDLKSCSGLVKSYAAVQRRLQTSVIHIGDQLGPVQQDGHQSFRARKEGRPLPLPPVLDPVVLSERGRWEQKKEKPNVEQFTPFQKKLWENPYAHVLASPTRECRSTSALLPNELLISLHPRPHPETSDLWLLPVNLTTTAKHLGVPFRFLGRKLIAEELGRKQNWRGKLYHRFTEKFGNKTYKMVWRQDMPDLILSLMRKNLLNKIRWHFTRLGELAPCASPRSEDIEPFDNVSCVLYLGSLKTRADELQARAEKIMHHVGALAQTSTDKQQEVLDPHKVLKATHHIPSWYKGPLIARLQQRVLFPPLDFKTTIWRGKQVAVYSLCDLLGEDKVQELVQSSRFEGERCLVMKSGRHNVPVEISLMQLQAFLATPGPY